MEQRLAQVSKRFWLNDEERKKVVYASSERNDLNAMWNALKELGGKEPDNICELKGISWGHDDDQYTCLVTWHTF